MTGKSSEEGGHSAVRLSRRRVLQLSSGAAVGGAFSSKAVSAAGAQSESDDDEIALEDDEFADVVGVSSERIYGPTQVIEGATETYRVNRAAHLDFVWSASNGAVHGDGPHVDVTFGSSGEAEVSVLVAEDGVPEAVGSLEVSVIEVSIGGPDEVAVGQRYEFEVCETIPGVSFQEWSITPSTAGSIDEYGERAEIEFEAEASPARIEVEYETGSGYTDTAEHEVDIKQIELQIENARLVQTVENTRVEDTDGTVLWAGEPNPDFVASRNASIGFDLDGKHVDLLKNDITIVVEREIVDAGSSRFISRFGDNSVVYDDEFELQVTDERNDVEEFVDAEHGIEELHKLANSHGVDVPVFSLDAGYDTRRELSSVEIRIEWDVVESDPVRVEKGRDFRVSNPWTLRIGFIALKDPDDGENYGAGNNGYPFDEDDWYDEYMEAVDEAVEMTKKIFPADEIESYAHQELMNGAVGILDDAIDDGIEAQDIIEEEFPEFDATILVVPEDYFEFHRDNELRGLHFRTRRGDLVSRQPAAADVVHENAMDELTPAHEIGHTFTEELYEGPDDHPVARRTDGIIPGREALDFHHARGTSDRVDGEYPGIGVRSTKFDLTDGTYEAKRKDIASVMSYDTGQQFTRWADARLFQYLLDEGFDPTPPETSSRLVMSSGLATDGQIEVLSGIATIEDDGIATIRYMRRREGNPMPPDGNGNVTLTLQSADGEELGTVTTVDEWIGLAEESFPISDTVPFVVPYPEELEAIVFDHEGTISIADPRGNLLANAKDRLAAESFIENPEDRLLSLQDKLESVDNQLQNRAYRGAYNKLTNDVRPRVEEWLHDDAAVPANYYTKSELLALLDDVIARLEALYDVHEDDKGQDPTEDHSGRRRPDDHPGRGQPDDHPGRGSPDGEEIEGGRGPPDEGEEFGRRPSDGDGHPGGSSDDDGNDDDDSPGRKTPPNDDDHGSRGNR